MWVKFHEYLTVTLYQTTKGELKIDMQKYLQKMIDEFPINIENSEAAAIPVTKNPFKVDGSNPLNKNKE